MTKFMLVVSYSSRLAVYLSMCVYRKTGKHGQQSGRGVNYMTPGCNNSQRCCDQSSSGCWFWCCFVLLLNMIRMYLGSEYKELPPDTPPPSAQPSITARVL